MTDDNESEARQKYFWHRITEEIGEVQPHIKNLLNFLKIAASVLITKLGDEAVITSVQNSIQKQQKEIEQYAERYGLELRNVFQNDANTFAFSELDRLMLRELADLVRTNGIKEFLPPKNQPPQTTKTKQPAPINNISKEIENLRKRLQGRYSAQAADFAETPIQIEREAAGVLAASVDCFICGKNKKYKCLRKGDESWQLSNITKHFDRHFGKSGSTRRKRIKVDTTARNLPTSSNVDPLNGTDYDSIDDSMISQGQNTDDESMIIQDLDNENSSLIDSVDEQHQTYRVIIDSVELLQECAGFELSDSVEKVQDSQVEPAEEQLLYDDYGENEDAGEEIGEQREADPGAGTPASNVESTEIEIFDHMYGLLQDAPILKVMVGMHVRNKHTNRHGRRFTDLEKDICGYQFLNSGKGHYTFWGRNMVNISSKTLKTHIKDNTMDIEEGVINVPGLKQYLVNNNFPLALMLCEDGTRISPAVQYEHTSDSLRGLVAPLDKTTGLPLPNVFVASSPTKMAQDISNHRVANYAYVQLAVPLCREAAPFVLFHMCTDNRFTADDVLNRWKLEKDLLAQENIQVIGNAADGDGRVLKGQKIRARFNREGSSYWGKWYIVNDDLDDPHIDIQDKHHILNKMKNRMAHNGKKLDLKIGNFTITTNHLKSLVKTLGKDKLNLTMADIDCKDRMKFGPTLKFINDQTIQGLEDCIPGSAGTVLYLKTMRKLYRSFIEEDLTPLERVAEIWEATFTIRGWKNWCLDENQKAKKNKEKGGAMKQFITSNANVGIELNAHSLIAFIEWCRKNDVPEQFIISILSSQHCEALFRSLRSSSTTNQTVVNFTAKELTNKLKSTQFKLDVMYRHKDNFDFPAINKMNNRKVIDSLPTFEQIQSAIAEAQVAARNELAKVGILNANLDPTMFRTQRSLDSISTEQDCVNDLIEEDDEESDSEDDSSVNGNEAKGSAEDVNDILMSETESEQSVLDREDLDEEAEFLEPEFIAVEDEFNSKRDESNCSEDEVFELDELFPECNGTINLKSSTTGSRHTFKIRDRKGNVKIIKKQTLVWMMTDGRYRLSTDRLRRFQQKEYVNVKL